MGRSAPPGFFHSLTHSAYCSASATAG